MEKMDFKYHLEEAWKLTFRFLAPLVIMTLVVLGVCAISLGLLGPVIMAGYTQSILLALREGKEPKITDIFSQMKLFLPLLLLGIACFIIVLTGFMLLFIPGILAIFAIGYICFFVLPLMTDQGLGLSEAVKQSYKTAMSGDKVDHFVTVILFFAISVIGGSVFVGLIFTTPFVTAFLASIYEEKFKQVPAEDITASSPD